MLRITSKRGVFRDRAIGTLRDGREAERRRDRVLPVSRDSLLRVDQSYASTAHRFVQLVFDAVFGAGFIPRLRPQIPHVVRAAELMGTR